MNAGRYDEAIPVLQQAVESFEPGTSDLNYAYALFNLGKSLRLAGRPDEAIPILEQRLQIPNQTGVVRRELELARAAVAGEGSPKPPKEGKAKSGDEGGDD
jgi:tetratricopeptide (TPR) repeat protein